MDTHENPICARLGHYVAGLSIAYCPHHMAWTAIVRAGDEGDDTEWRWQRLEFGPFDSDEDVIRHLVAELNRLCRADRAGWAAARTAREEPADPTTAG